MKKSVVILLALAIALPAMAQGRFGKDSAECVKYLSYYGDAVKNKNYEQAAPSWRKALSLCPPTASQNLFIHGQTIISQEIRKNAKNPEVVKGLVDTLLMLADIRAEYFPKSAEKSLNSKALNIINYFGKDYERVYGDLTVILDKIGTAASPAVFVKQMQAAVEMFKNGKMEADALMENYTKYMAVIDQKISEEQTSKTLGEVVGAKQDFETLFIESGVASCDNLVALYTPRYDANPTDEALLNSMVKMLSKSDCVNTDLFLKSVESLNAISPSAASTYALYKLYSSRDENDKAAEALAKAITLLEPTDAQTWADYTFELATYYFKKCGKSAPAVAAAKEVAEKNESYKGKAYLLIGTIWGSQKCSGDEVSSRAQFWVATDYMQKAKAADASLEEEANGLISQYRKYFPQQADAFMYDIVDGNGYTVSCGGMVEHTTVRTNK